MHEQSSRLHHHQEVVVGVDDVNVLGRERRRLGLRDGELDDRSGGDPVGPRPHLAVHAHRAGVDQARGRGPRADVGVLGEKAVEPRAAAVLGDDQLDGHARGRPPPAAGARAAAAARSA